MHHVKYCCYYVPQYIDIFLIQIHKCTHIQRWSQRDVWKKRKRERSGKSGWGSGDISGFFSAAVRGAEATLLEPPEPHQNRSRVGQESLGSAHRDTAVGNLTRTHWKTAQWAGLTVTAKPRMTDVGGCDSNPASTRRHLTFKYVGNNSIDQAFVAQTGSFYSYFFK